MKKLSKAETETYPDYWTRLQNLVDNNKAIIVGAYNPKHVFMVVPGGMWQVVDNSTREDSGIDILQTNILLCDKWGGSFATRKFSYVLRTMDCGNGVKFANGPMYGVMDARAGINDREGKVLKFFKYIAK